MSRYSPMTPDMQRVLDVLIQARASALRAVSRSDVLCALHGSLPPDAVCDALESLHDAALVSTVRVTRDGVSQDNYWPTGLHPIKPVQTLLEPTMPTLQEKIYRAIQAHGPIDRHALAQQSVAPPKSLDTLAKPLVDSGKVLIRMLFSTEQGKKLKHWLTPEQAATLDATAQQTAKSEASPDPLGLTGTDDFVSASTPALEEILRRKDAEIETLGAELATERRSIDVLRENLTGMMSDWTDILQALDVSTHEEVLEAIKRLDAMATVAEVAGVKGGVQYQALRATEHALRNDLAATHLILNHLVDRLQVESIEQIPGALDELLRALNARATLAEAKQSAPEIPVNETRTEWPGRLALLTYVDGYDLDLEYLLSTITLADAATEALAKVNEGGAERCTVVRVLGEAKRPAAIWSRMLPDAPATVVEESAP